MKFIFQKPDMDTVLTGVLLGYKRYDQIERVQDKAPEVALENASIYCIECGGSGQVQLGNFDHHDTNLKLPPACVQACRWKRVKDTALLALVSYVENVDLGRRSPAINGNKLSLSNIFSGMRLFHSDPMAQFLAGIEIFEAVLSHGIDPWTPVPRLAEWQKYAEAKRRHKQALSGHEKRAEFFVTRSGLNAGYLEAPCPGIHGLLRSMGCEITIARGLSEIGSKTYSTIAGKSSNIWPVLSVIKGFETGWGGPAHGEIIASPRAGSRLRKDELISIVSDCI